MRKCLVRLVAGGAIAFASAYGITFTEELRDTDDKYGVFWCPLVTAPTEVKSPLDVPTEAEFNQKISVLIKDLGDWWSVNKSTGLTEETSLESFINKLELVIDGVPLKHLHPIAERSYTPDYPDHAVPTNDVAIREKNWRDWAITTARRNAENKPTLESIDHVGLSAAVKADRDIANGWKSQFQASDEKKKAGLATDPDDKINDARKAWLTVARRAATGAVDLARDDLAEAETANTAVEAALKEASAAPAATSVRAHQTAVDARRQLAQAVKNAQDSARVADEAINELGSHPNAGDEAKQIRTKLDTVKKGAAKLALYFVASQLSPAEAAAASAAPPPAGKGERYHALTFSLVRKDEDQAAWMEILRPSKVLPELRHRCRVSVGFERKDGAVQEMVSWVRPVAVNHFERPADQFYLVVMPTRMLKIFGGVFAFAILVLVLAGISGLLKDHDSPPRPDGEAPYSLARCQMAVWFLLISLSFVFLWQMLGRKDTVNNTATILLGISSFTAVGSALIGRADGGPCASRKELQQAWDAFFAVLSGLRKELKGLQELASAKAKELAALKKQQNADEATAPSADGAEISPANAAPAPALVTAGKIAVAENDLSALRAQITTKENEIAAKKAESADTRKRLDYAGPLGIFGFFKDILRDSDQKLSIAHFQMMVWTIVLAVVFFVEVYWNLSMPEFNPAILALLGITSGTYLGFKGATEKRDAH